MAMKKKGAAKGGVRKMKAGSRIQAMTAAEKKRKADAKEATRRATAKAYTKSLGQETTATERAARKNALRRDNASAANNAAADAGRKNYRVEGQKNPSYETLDVSSRKDEVKDRMLKNKGSYSNPSRKPKPVAADYKSKGGAVAKKKAGGAMKKKGYAKGGAVTKKQDGGKLEMVKNKAGKMVPAFAADGKGKMAKGGAVAKRMGGGMMKKKGYAKGGKMMKKGYAKGGKVKAMSRGGVARGSGAARPQKFTRNG